MSAKRRVAPWKVGVGIATLRRLVQSFDFTLGTVSAAAPEVLA